MEMSKSGLKGYMEKKSYQRLTFWGYAFSLKEVLTPHMHKKIFI
jgi:hypothetical protein